MDLLAFAGGRACIVHGSRTRRGRRRRPASITLDASMDLSQEASSLVTSHTDGGTSVLNSLSRLRKHGRRSSTLL